MFYGFLLLLILSFPVFSGEEKGVAEEFSRVEQSIANPKLSEAEKTKIFEKNILSNLKLSISKRETTVSPNVDFSKVAWEKVPNSFKIYVRYNEYYIFYDFSRDPSIYLQFPKEEILLKKPKGSGTDPAHGNDQQPSGK